MSNCAAEEHSFSPVWCLCRYNEDYRLLLNDSSPQVVKMLPFREVEVESVVPFQELGANFTFCCVAINREGNSSDMFHSLTITSKIQTGILAEWGRIWGLLEANLPIHMSLLSCKRGGIVSTSPLSSQEVGGFGVCQS